MIGSFLAPQTEAFAARIEALAAGATVVRPEGDGPFPVVMQLHGCGGRKPLQDRWAEIVRDAGWAAVIVDSHAHRRISDREAYATVCTGLRFRGAERAGDLFASMEWVRAQTWADASRIVVAGWSHGGWTALDAMAMHVGAEAQRLTGLEGLPDEPLAGLVGAFLIYPFASPPSLARLRGLRVDVAPLAIVGGSDVIVGGRRLGRALQRMKTPGAPIDVVLFGKATHAFDELEAKDLRVRYDAGLTKRAQGLLVDYLRRVASRAAV